MKNASFPVYPRISQAQFTSWNEDMFVRFNNERVYFHPNRVIRFVERHRVTALLNFLQPFHDSDRILAAGCGEGFIEKQISAGHLTLVDLSQEAIKRAQSHAYQVKDKKFVIANLEKLPFPPSSFNKIECSEVIEHVYSPPHMLREFHRVLTPDGLLVISFPNEPLINFLKKILIFFHLFHHFFPHVPPDMTAEWHLRPLSLRLFKTFARPDWKIVSVRPIPFPFLPIRFVVLCRKTPTTV